MLKQVELQSPALHSFQCHRDMSGGALSSWKIQLGKAAQLWRHRRSYHSQQLAQPSRAFARAELHSEVAQAATSSTSAGLDGFLSGLHFEARKGFRNVQGKEKFAEFAARHTKHLLSGRHSERLSDIAEAFTMYDALSVRDRKAVVDKAIQEVYAMTASPSAQHPTSKTRLTGVSSTASASSGGMELQPSSQQPVTRVSSLKNLVGDESRHGGLAADSQHMQASTASSVHGARACAEQQHAVQVSKRNRGMRLMTAEGAHATAQLLSVADLAAACTGTILKDPASVMQPDLHPEVSPTAAAPQLHTSNRHLEGFSTSSLSSAAEQALRGSPTAVLVGEDEEFSVGSDVDARLHDSAANPALTDAVGKTRRMIKPETAAFRASFTRAAAAAAGTSLGRSRRSGEELGLGEQRTAEWHSEREHRLTASAFGNALGFWPEGRVRLWEEKLQLRKAFAGNAATQWGTVQEDVALKCYSEVTGHVIKPCRFAVLRDDEVHGWLGASPDGLIDSLSAQPAHPDALAAGMGPGVLEIKCPFNRGQPESASVPSLPPWYYMPQVQGLMEIFQREWCNIYMWTVNGSAMFHIPRDRQYWTACFEVLSEFWWAHLVPAKHAIASNRREDAYRFMPSPSHKLTAGLSSWSKAMAKAAPANIYSPSQRG